MKNQIRIGLGCLLLLAYSSLAFAGRDAPSKKIVILGHAGTGRTLSILMHADALSNFALSNRFEAASLEAKLETYKLTAPQPFLCESFDYRFINPPSYPRPVNDPKPDNTKVQLILKRQLALLKMQPSY